MRGLRPYLPFALAALAFVGLRVATFLPTSPRVFGDTAGYLHVAEQPLVSFSFLAGARPWTVPLLYKLLPDSDTARTAAQLGISILCWLVLAGVVAWCVRRHALRVVAFAAVLLAGLSVWVTQWDSIVLSESLAISLTVLVVASWLVVVRQPSLPFALAALAVTALWTFARDTNPFLVAGAIALVLIGLGHPKRRRGVLALSAGLLAIFVAALWSAGGPKTPDERWARPLRNVIGQRVLTTPEELRYFEGRGMPAPPALLALAGAPLGEVLGPGSPQRDDARFAPFQAWLHDHGRQTLTRYLLRHPYQTIEPVVRDRDQLFPANAAGQLAYYRAPGTDPLLPEPLASIAYPPSVLALGIWLVLVTATLASLARLGAFRPTWLVPGAILVLQVPHAIVVWHGDTFEVWRHAVLVGLMTRLSLLLLTIFAVDALLERRRPPPHGLARR